MNKKVMTVVVSLLAILTIAFTYIIANRPALQVTLYVDPQITSRSVDQDFTVNINISNVAHLYGWQVKLGWNTTILNVIITTEGQFLKNGGNTFFTPSINNTAGYVMLDCTLLGSVSGVSGSGTIVTIQFHVKTSGNSDLDLYDTILLDSSEQSISHIVRDGRFNTSTL